MDHFKNRRLLIVGVMFTLIGILVIRLFYVQVVAEEYKQFAEQNSKKTRIQFASRGLIYGRDGTLLVSNEPVYYLKVNLSKVEAFDTTLLCEILKVDKDFMLEKLATFKPGQLAYYKEFDIYKLMDKSQYAQFQERRFLFRGFRAQPHTQRKYHQPIAANVFGYLGEVNKREMADQPGEYVLTEQIGKEGLEKYYEDVLRGRKGREYVIVDKYNRVQGKYFDGKEDVKPLPGASLITTIDPELQAYGEKLMQNKMGAVVAIDPNTGEILALVSSISYPPELLVGRKRMENYPKLSTNKWKPMYNRAIAAKYAPGSTFKTIMALVGLQEGVIHTQSTFNCQMGYHIPGLSVGCHEHQNYLNLEQSIAQSCNAYYCNVFRLVIDQPKFAYTEEGFANWYQYMRQFGMGAPLGIDLPGETSGDLPSVETYNSIYPKGSWRSSYIISLGIGQGEIGLTPLQMANFTAAIANRGFYYQPHLVKEQQFADSTHRPTFTKNTISIDRKHFDVVVDGMEQVFISGTARWYSLDSVVQCGKTGTAENPHGDDHSNFIAFAPKDNPQIAIAVVVENAGFGSTWAAPIASLMIEKYLGLNAERKWFEDKMLEKDFIHIPDSAEMDSLTESLVE